jgi:acyl-CoA synthetase (AMP-forming)/AMP-acid ligase II
MFTPVGNGTLIDALCVAPAEKPFITVWHNDDDIEQMTFGEFVRSSTAKAAQFRDLGLSAGDRVIVILPQGAALMAAFAGAMMLGAVPAILAYPNFKVEPQKYAAGLAGVTRNLQARLVVVDDEFPSAWLEHITLAEGARLARVSPEAVSSSDFPLPRESQDPAGLAFIQHSAGTTGLQKGVALSHAAVLTQLRHLAAALKISDQDRLYSWLPLYHDMGLVACFMLPLVYHLPIVMQSPMEWVVHPGSMMRLISEFRCTLAWLPNFAYQLLARRVRSEDRLGYDLASLRALVNCSEPVRAQSMDEFVGAYRDSQLPPDVVKTSYAMAENVFAVTQSSVDGAPCRILVDGPTLWSEHKAVPVDDGVDKGVCFVSSGRCIGGNRVRIADTNGIELEEGRLGEILIQSDSLFGGYFNRPELTVEAFQDGWYRSGDLGFIHDGELYVIGRKKDLIIVAGKNIYPQDIEEIVCSHPAIHDGRSVAFGLYNSDLGTDDIIIVAETEREESLKGSYEIERAVRNAIVAELDVVPHAIYLKPPRWIVKSTAGKPARSTTREKLLIEHPELIGSEHEYLFELLSESVMTRSMTGTISSWNRSAAAFYGWGKDEAIGRVSHDLLQTQFPIPLEDIESELIQSGRWEGKLVHFTRDGGRVVVNSRWIWNPKEKSKPVVEINTPSTDC